MWFVISKYKGNVGIFVELDGVIERCLIVDYMCYMRGLNCVFDDIYNV